MKISGRHALLDGGATRGRSRWIRNEDDSNGERKLATAVGGPAYQTLEARFRS